MAEKFPRSPYDSVKGLVYFARMLDKIRLHAAGDLPEVYHKHLGTDFDGRCLRFLGVKYDDVKKLVLGGRERTKRFWTGVISTGASRPRRKSKPGAAS